MCFSQGELQAIFQFVDLGLCILSFPRGTATAGRGGKKKEKAA